MEEKEVLGTKVPLQAIDKFVAPVQRFLKIESTAGIGLIAVTIIALLWANLSNETYLAFWSLPFNFTIGPWSIDKALHHAPTLGWLVNDALMTIFFFSVGLEVKGEIVHGELHDMRKALLPVLAAIGGMIFPAVIYLVICPGEAHHGWGIPMATDIAFTVGCMALLGTRIPHGLRVMILTLAIADDIGSIIVVAVGYSSGVQWSALGIAVIFLTLTWLSFRLGIRNLFVHGVLAVISWFCFVQSGVHPTICGVIIGLLTPVAPMVKRAYMDQLIVTVGDAVKENRPMTNDQRKEVLAMLEKTSRESGSLQGRLNTHLQPWVNFVIMPLFALANAGVVIEPSAVSLVTLSVALGLVIGKPLGIFLVSFAAIKAKICMLPTGVNWKILLGGGMLAGIGFTMSLFVAGLAFGDPAHTTYLAGAKVGILTGSFASAIFGILFMKIVSKPTNTPEESSSDAVEPV